MTGANPACPTPTTATLGSTPILPSGRPRPPSRPDPPEYAADVTAGPARDLWSRLRWMIVLLRDRHLRRHRLHAHRRVVVPRRPVHDRDDAYDRRLPRGAAARPRGSDLHDDRDRSRRRRVLVTIAVTGEWVAEAQLGPAAGGGAWNAGSATAGPLRHLRLRARGQGRRARVRGRGRAVRGDRPERGPHRTDGRGRGAVPRRRSVGGTRAPRRRRAARAGARLRGRLRCHERLHHADRSLAEAGAVHRRAGLGAGLGRAASAGRARTASCRRT